MNSRAQRMTSCTPGEVNRYRTRRAAIACTLAALAAVVTPVVATGAQGVDPPTNGEWTALASSPTTNECDKSCNELLHSTKVVVASDGNGSVSLSVLADADVGEPQLVAPGVTVYPNSAEATDTVVQRTDDGSSISVVISDASAPTTFRFPIDLPEGGVIQPDGSGYSLLDAAGDVIGEITAPWALDATGAEVPTYYSLEGTTIVQHVYHHGAAYPVVADPTTKFRVTWGWVSGTVYFNRAETRSIAQNAFGAFLKCWTSLPPPFDGYCAAISGWTSAVAAASYARGGCVKLKFGFLYVTPGYDPRGGDCR